MKPPIAILMPPNLDLTEELVYNPPPHATLQTASQRVTQSRLTTTELLEEVAREPFKRHQYEPRCKRKAKQQPINPTRKQRPTRPHGFGLIAWFYQLTALSFFGLNVDSLVKIATLLLTVVFEIVNICAHVPCFMNCVYDVAALFTNGLSRDLMQFILVYVKLIYILVIEVELIRKGGRIQFAFKKLERYSDHYRVGIDDKRIKQIVWTSITLVFFCVLDAVLHVGIIWVFDERLLYRKTQLDRFAQFQAESGNWKYKWA